MNAEWRKEEGKKERENKKKGKKEGGRIDLGASCRAARASKQPDCADTY